MSKKATTIENRVKEIFPDAQVFQLTNGIKFHVKEILDIHIIELSKLARERTHKFKLKRSGTGITGLVLEPEIEAVFCKK